jgi:hypothetical protein
VKAAIRLKDIVTIKDGGGGFTATIRARTPMMNVTFSRS